LEDERDAACQRARQVARCASTRRGGEPARGEQARPRRWAGAWELSSLDTGGSDAGRRRSPTAARHVRVRRERVRPNSAEAERVRWRRMHSAQAMGGHEHESALAGEGGGDGCYEWKRVRRLTVFDRKRKDAPRTREVRREEAKGCDRAEAARQCVGHMTRADMQQV
jgi:hypothetical protein